MQVKDNITVVVLGLPTVGEEDWLNALMRARWLPPCFLAVRRFLRSLLFFAVLVLLVWWCPPPPGAAASTIPGFHKKKRRNNTCLLSTVYFLRPELIGGGFLASIKQEP